ncbi:MAP3K12-binding inhibitory protein 1 [Trichonephila inaurata madagascariensis]|uniref:MAP3K12-binding inhibitory protein 1 n=1 Tax=Trichonephila inaurata madagascariensis TaxID=2747483 RepID=A0A8X6XBW4_9ARAC|nr:MAP3K12-binding inhibitory protein 1 [Trichonephila inaurata madagascariensis]
MSDEKKVVVEAVLKKPLEENEENWDKFESAFTTFVDKVNELPPNKNSNQKETLQAQNLDRDSEEDVETQVDIAASDAKADLESQEVSNMGTNHEENRDFDLDSEVDESPVSDIKACENTAWKVQCVSDMDSSREADESSSSSSDNNVEMDVTSEQMWQKINAFKNFIRQQKNEKNVQEYCGRPYIDESNPLWGQINTCARVDAVFIPRYNNSRHKVTRMANRLGPQAQSSNEEANQNAAEPEDAPAPNIENIVETIQERLRIMEEHLDLISAEGMDVFDKLEELEDRVMYVEALARELLRQRLSEPIEYINEEDSSEEDMSDDDDDITGEEVNEAENVFKFFE